MVIFWPFASTSYKPPVDGVVIKPRARVPGPAGRPRVPGPVVMTTGTRSYMVPNNNGNPVYADVATVACRDVAHASPRQRLKRLYTRRRRCGARRWRSVRPTHQPRSTSLP